MPVIMLQITPTWVNLKRNQTLEAMNEKQPTLLQFNYVFAIIAHALLACAEEHDQIHEILFPPKHKMSVTMLQITPTWVPNLNINFMK
jgi:hypothetical protein